ncbi:MAG: hypothetical protein HYT50_01005 [Candidatus Wildermuthbacteria bacterium]|nr:hypothetical protein [Candidatus Wildermuthbacteria bacterium]
MPPDITFRPKIIIPDIAKESLKRVGESVLRNLVFHLGLMEIPSYWKATCSPSIVIEAGYLTQEQMHWWKDLILEGMGEFFFQNRIDFTKPDFLSLACSHAPEPQSAYEKPLQERAIVPVGGGKDAAVTLELLKNSKMDIRSFMLNPKKEQLALARISKTANALVAKRTIDPKLLELNQQGYLNGHTPFSAYLAFITALEAALFDYKYIALSNERSSNEGNVEYLETTINHQYSKSFEFEKKFREYSKAYLANDLEYFSFLRPLYELQIAKLFSRYPKYFPAFLSCNEAHKTISGIRKPTGKWCARCPKCLFVFLALYPFVGKAKLENIFKKNLFEDLSLVPLAEELLGLRNFKPFECVGTEQESRAALLLSLKAEKGNMPKLLAYFAKRMPKDSPDPQHILRAWNNKHFLPSQFTEILKKAIDETV